MILLDAQLVRWAVSNDQRFPGPVEEQLAERRNEVPFGAVSIWETAVKAGLGRDDFEADQRELRRG